MYGFILNEHPHKLRKSHHIDPGADYYFLAWMCQLKKKLIVAVDPGLKDDTERQMLYHQCIGYGELTN